jgi:hypothetical protein
MDIVQVYHSNPQLLNWIGHVNLADSTPNPNRFFLKVKLELT